MIRIKLIKILNTIIDPSHAINACERVIETGWLLIFGLVPLIFLPIIYSTVHVAEYILFQILVEIIAFVWIVKIILMFRHRVSNWTLGVQVLPAFIFIVILGIATLFSQSPHMSFWGYHLRKMGYIIWLHFFAFFAVLFFNLKNKKQVTRILYVIGIATVFVVAYGLLQISGFEPFRWGEPAHITHRIFSTLGQPNFLASWLLLTIPVVIGFLLLSSHSFTYVGRSRTSTDTALGMIKSVFKQYFLRPLLIVLFFLSIFALVFTQSRGGWIGAFFGFFFFTIIFSWIKAYKRIGIFLLTLLIICIGVIVYFNFHPLDFDSDDTFLERRVKTLTNVSTYGERRLIVWRDSLDLISKKPLIGYGPEVQKLNFVSYYTPEFAALEAINAYPDRAHNDMLDTLLISGVLGLISYLFFISFVFYLALKHLFKRTQVPKHLSTQAPILCLLTGVFAYLISLQFSFHVIPTAVYFWGYLAIINAQLKMQNAK